MENYKFKHQLEIRVNDINYGGHLGNDRYLAFFHEARIQYLRQFNLSEANIGDNLGMIMSEAYVKFKAEAFIHDILEIHVRVVDLKGTRFTFEYSMYRPSDKRVIGTGYTKMAAFDYTKRKVTKIPVSFANLIAAHEK